MKDETAVAVSDPDGALKSKWGFLWTIAVGYSLMKMFGIVGLIATFITYRLAQAKLGTAGAVILSILVGYSSAAAVGAGIARIILS